MSTVKIDWSKLFEGQKQLDSYIFKKKNTNYKETSKERILALAVEVLELANSTKVFKFWSSKEGGKEDILEEYVDGIHFILSILLEREIQDLPISFEEPEQKDKKFLTKSFLSLINKFNEDMSNESFKEWTQDYIKLGSYLGFHWNEIEKMYWNKWEINFKRQDSKY